MRKLLFSVILCLFAFLVVSAQTPAVKYVDALSLNMIGKFNQTTHPYHRADTTLYKFIPSENQLVRETAGLALSFKTNSSIIMVKTSYYYRANSTSTPYVAKSGYDLYIKSNGEWLYAASQGERTNEKPLKLISNMDSSMKECLLYLPAFSEIKSLEIGVAEDAKIEAMPNPFRHKIILFGSSYMHGASAARPGMSVPMQLERNTGLYIMSMAVSGNSKLQPEFARMFAAADAEAFIFDAFSNPSAEEIEARVEKFVEVIRGGHPTTPLIFIRSIYREKGNFDLKTRAFEEAKAATAEKMMKKIMAKDKNVYFVNLKNQTGTDHITSADGTHPSDLGYWRWANTIQPEIQKILKKYGIE